MRHCGQHDREAEGSVGRSACHLVQQERFAGHTSTATTSTFTSRPASLVLSARHPSDVPYCAWCLVPSCLSAGDSGPTCLSPARLLGLVTPQPWRRRADSLL
ncbi:hypothetical protein E2C01_002997 [Portunus trituberculatus]|uniref:Uncharacterized protein n=1 Tax=Portunus trituberculatus TaxID=210409 RepID=A0A5B7CNZ9_PORTR|nr:hypothetical protein [Portunus trituberculatus]